MREFLQHTTRNIQVAKIIIMFHILYGCSSVRRDESVCKSVVSNYASLMWVSNIEAKYL